MALLITWDTFALTSKYVMLPTECRTVYFKLHPHECINYFKTALLPKSSKKFALTVDFTKQSEDYLVIL